MKKTDFFLNLKTIRVCSASKFLESNPLILCSVFNVTEFTVRIDRIFFPLQYYFADCMYQGTGNRMQGEVVVYYYKSGMSG